MGLEGNDGRPDGELIHGTLGGDVSAFDALHARHHVRISRLIHARLWNKGCSRPEDHAPEVTQDSWRLIYANLKQMSSDFNSWSAVLSINEANRHLRKCLVEKGHSSPPAVREGGEEQHRARFADFRLAYEAQLLFEKAVEEAHAISSRFGNIFEMRCKYEMEFEEIAIQLGLSKEVVRADYYRKLPELRRRMG